MRYVDFTFLCKILLPVVQHSLSVFLEANCANFWVSHGTFLKLGECFFYLLLCEFSSGVAKDFASCFL